MNRAVGLDGKTDSVPERVSVLGTDYLHLCFPTGDEMYLTGYGLPYSEDLRPENFWADKRWFRAHSMKLSGTSTLYRIRTKRKDRQGKDIVLKWNRVGQEVPGGASLHDDPPGEFNGPFEEFSLVMELRAVAKNEHRLITHRPLAIYVPAGTVSLERLGRKERLMEPKVALHKGVVLDTYRNYAVIYEWLKGIDAAEACKAGLIDPEQMERLVFLAATDLAEKGFAVGDNKPHHVIIRPESGKDLKRNRSGRPLYGLVDFELLARTPQKEASRRSARRSTYLRKQKSRFMSVSAPPLPRHLKPVRLKGVDYVYGRVLTTGGRLWVVGADPDLFDYFLPEKWEGTARKRLSKAHEIYYTLTKDDVHIVWKLSRVGQKPTVDPFREKERKVLEHGYNSPFEEFSLAMELASKEILTVYPRAIYMAGRSSCTPAELQDHRRYQELRHLKNPDGTQVLQPDHDYFSLWGYWNGPDEKLAALDADYYEGISALNAYRRGILPEELYLHLIQRLRERLGVVGVEDMNLTGSHLLLSLDSEGKLVSDSEGEPEVRICNFELLKRRV